MVEKALLLGESLVEQGLLTTGKLQLALVEHRRSGRTLGRVLVESGYVTEEQVARTVAQQLKLPFVDLKRFELVPGTVRILGEAQARRYRALVLEDRDDHLLIGLVDPSDLRSYDELNALLRRPIEMALITQDQFSLSADRIYRKTTQIGEFAKEIERDIESMGNVVDLNALNDEVLTDDAPVVKLLRTVFDDAVQVRASDIHIEPQAKRLVVRFRIDGVLHTQLEADPRIASAVVVRLKLMADLDIAEKRLPQDGRIAVKTGNRRIDVRMSTMPSQHGESVVLRVLVGEGDLIDIEKSGMPQAIYKQFMKLVGSPHGIVLVTGPTGSGKTTTLYGALQKINTPQVKILTVEDPVEYRLPGIVQVQVNERIELGFARVLRSFLRQDPDVLLVGEIRDQETAQIAARAAMTGHLVLSTIHTNDAVSTPGRLLDMGVAGYLIASTVLAVLAQRLIRVNCKYCSEAYTPTPGEMAWINHFRAEQKLEHSELKLKRGLGCVRCNEVGFYGRRGIHELLEMTPPLAALLQSSDPRQFEKAAQVQLGHNTMRHHVLELVLAGETTVEEAMQVVTSL